MLTASISAATRLRIYELEQDGQHGLNCEDWATSLLQLAAKEYADPQKDPAPTSVPPGPKRVAVLALRRRRRQSLWNRNDMTWDQLAAVAETASRERNGSVTHGDLISCQGRGSR